MFTAAVREDIQNSVLCWLATVSGDAQPNVSPKEVFCAHGEASLLIAEIASPTSLRNLADNPKVCVSLVDVFRQRGFKLLGHATVVLPEQPRFEAIGGELLAMAGPDFTVRAIIEVTVTQIQRIWAPSYARFPDRTVETQMDNGYKTYGVRPA